MPRVLSLLFLFNFSQNHSNYCLNKPTKPIKMNTFFYALDTYETLSEEWQHLHPSTSWRNHSLIDLNHEHKDKFESSDFSDRDPGKDNTTDVAEYSDTNGDASDFWLDEESSTDIDILTPSDDHYHEAVRTSLSCPGQVVTLHRKTGPKRKRTAAPIPKGIHTE